MALSPMGMDFTDPFYAKFSRPYMVYITGIVIWWDYTVLPTIQVMHGKDNNPIDLPEAFWWFAAAVLGIYITGKSYELGAVAKASTSGSTPSTTTTETKVSTTGPMATQPQVVPVVVTPVQPVAPIQP